MTEITRQKALAIKADLVKAMKEIAEKHGVNVEPVRGSFNTTRFGGKFAFTNKSAAVVASSGIVNTDSEDDSESSTIPSHIARIYQIDPTAVGPKGEVLAGYYPSRRKYPFVYKSVRGARWKITGEQAQEMFPRSA